MQLDPNLEELAATAHRRVNVGCGDYYLMHFTNIDEEPTKFADIHQHVPPLPFEDASVDMVWACHFFEHLDRAEAAFFLEEAKRVLVEDGVLGIVVPDTREIMQRWLDGSIDAVECPPDVWHRINDLDEVCELFLYSTVQDSPHKWSYDKITLGRMMHQAGFRQLKELDRYADSRIAQGAWYQFGIEGKR